MFVYRRVTFYKWPYYNCFLGGLRLVEGASGIPPRTAPREAPQELQSHLSGRSATAGLEAKAMGVDSQAACWSKQGGRYMDVSKNGGTPKWMVKIMENPIKMDDLGGKPTIFGNIHMTPTQTMHYCLMIQKYGVQTNHLIGISFPLFWGFFLHPRCCKISEPSTVLSGNTSKFIIRLQFALFDPVQKWVI